MQTIMTIGFDIAKSVFQVHCVDAEGKLRHPITGIAGCCARAANDNAAAPPTSVMNSRRCMLAPWLWTKHPNGSNENFDRG